MAAQAAGRFLITQDLSFSDARRYAPGTHAGLLLMRLAHPGRDALLARVTTVFSTEPRDMARLPRGGDRTQDSPQSALTR